MKTAIIIPAHNEQNSIEACLLSLCQQNVLPHQIVVVNDNSTDQTAQKVAALQEKYPFISLINNPSENAHLPGQKIINAFNAGLQSINLQNFDIICKFDADLVFPSTYLAQMQQNYTQNTNLGMFGGVCTIEKNNSWQVENLTDRTHLRGGLKSYRRACFETIGGLKNAMGWDTIDELLARYHGYQVVVYSHLHVKHLRPTGALYSAKSSNLQGQMFYQTGYGFALTAIASVKLALAKGNISLVKDYFGGYLLAWKNKTPKLVSVEEEKWIRSYRWKNIRRKLGWI